MVESNFCLFILLVFVSCIRRKKKKRQCIWSTYSHEYDEFCTELFFRNAVYSEVLAHTSETKLIS